MGRCSSWLLSTVIHGALLVGALIPMVANSGGIGDRGSGNGPEGGFVCSIREPADFLTPAAPEPAPAPCDGPLRYRWEVPRPPRALPQDPLVQVASGRGRKYFRELFRGEECGFGRELEFEEKRTQQAIELEERRLQELLERLGKGAEER